MPSICTTPRQDRFRPRTLGLTAASLALGFFTTGLQAQTKPAASQPDASPTKVLEGDAAQEHARTILREAAKRHQRIESLQGAFTQEVFTPLLKKPLRSKGTFSFRKEPACVVFSIAEPEPTVCRFDEISYQVYRPKAARAERFLFGEGEVGKSLVRVFSPDPNLVSKELNVASVTETGDQTTIALKPTEEAMKNFLVDLEITLDTKAGYITALAYTNAEGDKTVLMFTKVRTNKPIPEDRFTRTLPKGTDIKLTEMK